MSRAPGKNPAFQFYPKDWTADTGVLTPTNRGIWMDIICFLWAREPKGTATCKVSEWATAARCSEAEILAAFEQFERLGTADVSRDGHGYVTLTCRRMVRDEQQRRSDMKRQRQHRQKGQPPVDVTGLSRDSHTLSPTPTPSPCPSDIPPKPPAGGVAGLRWLHASLVGTNPELTELEVMIAGRGLEPATAQQIFEASVELLSMGKIKFNRVKAIRDVLARKVCPVGVKFEKRNSAPPAEQRRMDVSPAGEMS